jgi:hypothetical protein
MSNYNPYISAFSAATAELTSASARAYYSRRAQSDTQSVIIAAVQTGVALYEAAVFTYSLGVFIRALYESTKPQPECTAIVLAQSTAITLVEVEILEAEIIPTTSLLLSPAAPEDYWVMSEEDAAILHTAAQSLYESMQRTDEVPIKYLAAAKEAVKKATPTKKKPRTKKRSLKEAIA